MNAQDLKNSILQLAVQGKLVPQDPTDEPASELLKRIRKEKDRLAKEGKIRKEKPLPAIGEDEIPFEIPETWVWVRLQTVCKIERGGSPRPIGAFLTQAPDGINWIKIGDTEQGGKFIYSTREKIKPEGLKHTRLVEPDDFLLTNSMSFGRPYICKITGAIHDGWLRLSFDKGVFNSEFLYYQLCSQMVFGQFQRLAAGSGVKNLKIEKVEQTIVVLPPLAEQARIVAKIEELLPKVAEYGEARERLAELNAVVPEQLRKSILQQAVQGKLTERDPSDEPASLLLDRIRAEKARLIAAGQLRREKPLPQITDDEIPFEIPETWVWVRLGELCLKLTDGAHRTPAYKPRGIPFLSVKDMSSGELDFSNTKFISEEEHQELCLRCNPERGDLLISKVGTTGIPAIVNTDRPFSLFVSVALLKIPQELLNVKFLYYLVYSPLVSAQAKENTKGIGNKNWVIDCIKNTIIPLPPLAEQARIVERVETLLAICSRLKD